MIKVNDVVEIYKWKKPRYLGKIVGHYPVGCNRFYKVSVLTPIEGAKVLHWKQHQFSTSKFRVDVVPEDNVVRICDGTKSDACDKCKHRFACFATW